MPEPYQPPEGLRGSPPPAEPARRGPFPWRALLGSLSELAGLALIGYVLWLAWWPLPLGLVGALLIYLPNRK